MHRLTEAPGQVRSESMCPQAGSGAPPGAAPRGRRRLPVQGTGELQFRLPHAVAVGGDCRNPRRPTQPRTI
jgi:hypothetical protein